MLLTNPVQTAPAESLEHKTNRPAALARIRLMAERRRENFKAMTSLASIVLGLVAVVLVGRLARRPHCDANLSGFGPDMQIPWPSRLFQHRRDRSGIIQAALQGERDP